MFLQILVNPSPARHTGSPPPRPGILIFFKEHNKKKMLHPSLIIGIEPNLSAPTWQGDAPSGYRAVRAEDPIFDGRPDLFSAAVYGSDSYFDVICRHNGISCPLDFHSGRTYIIPIEPDAPDQTIYDDPEADEPGTGRGMAPGGATSSTPGDSGRAEHVAKALAQKTRWSIDTARGVVIY